MKVSALASPLIFVPVCVTFFAVFAVSPAVAATVFIPIDSCLEEISSHVEALGRSAVAAENKIDFENVLRVRGDRWEILYYKISPEDPQVLGITGRAVVRLKIRQATRDGRYLEVRKCSVRAGRILKESRS